MNTQTRTVDIYPGNIYPLSIGNNILGGLCMEGCVRLHGRRWVVDFRRRQVGGFIRYDDRGQKFWCKEHAEQYLSKIRNEVTGNNFDIEKYVKSSREEWQFNNRYKIFIDRNCDKNGNEWAPSYVRKIIQYGEKYFIPFFEKRDLRDIEDISVDNFFHSLPKHLGIKTKKNIINVLRSFFYTHKIIRKKQLEFPNPIPPTPACVWIESEDQEKILYYIPLPHHPIYLFMIHHGARPGEARALQWDCVDLKKNIITIKRTYSDNKLRNVTKGKKDRIIPIYSEFRAIIESLPRALNGFVFRNQRGGHYGANILPRLWNEAVKKAGVAPINLYNGTRHSFASQLLKAGATLKEIGGLLGHADERTTTKYAHAGDYRHTKVIELRKKTHTLIMVK